jgi:hypothetical protein
MAQAELESLGWGSLELAKRTVQIVLVATRHTRDLTRSFAKRVVMLGPFALARAHASHCIANAKSPHERRAHP